MSSEGISFEEIVAAVEEDLKDILVHPNQRRYTQARLCSLWPTAIIFFLSLQLRRKRTTSLK